MLQSALVTTQKRRGRPPLPPEQKKKRVQTSIRLKPDEYRLVKALALARGKTMNALIRTLAEEALERHPAKALIKQGLESGALEEDPSKSVADPQPKSKKR